MIAVALTQILIAGLPAAILLDRTASRLRQLGLSFLLGTGITYFTMLALPRWSVLATTIAILTIAAILWFFALRTRYWPVATPFHPIDFLTLALLVVHGVAAFRPIRPRDFWAIWGLKARVFLAHGGIDWDFLEHPWNAFQHSDYPLLLPLNYVFVAQRDGEWNEAHLVLLGTCFAAALLFILRDVFAAELGRLLGACATLGIASTALSPFFGMAEAPLIAFSAAGLVYVRRGAMTTGAILLGLAACTKNEGLTFIVAAAVALALAGRRRDAVRLWPALLVAAPWLLARAMYAFPTDLLAGPVLERVAHNLPLLPFAFRGESPLQPWLWVAIGVAFLVCLRDLKRERFLLIATLLQLAFYLGAYAVTPNELRWHVIHTFARLLEHAAVPLAFAALVLTGARLRDRGEERDRNGHERADDHDWDHHADERDQ